MKKVVDMIKSSNIKSKVLLKNIFISLLIKGLGLFVSLFTMPSYIKFFNNDTVLGVWFTAISILNWILTFDFGVGNGLRNLLVEPLKENNKEEIKTYISSTYVSVFILFSFFTVISLIIFPFINWNDLFNISSDIVGNDVLHFMSQVLFIGIMLNFLFNSINSIFYAMQKSFVPSLLNLISTILILLYMNLFNSNDVVINIKNLSIINCVASVLPFIVATIILFSGKLKSCAPKFSYFNWQTAKKVIKLGMTFFLLQILTLLMFGFNEFLISQLTLPDNVVEYQIYNKLFSLIATLFNLMMTPVWSAVREGCIEKDAAWIKRIYKYINSSLLIIMIIEFVLTCLLQFIVNIWLGKGYMTINYWYCVAFALSTLLQMKLTIDSSFSNGLGNLKWQTISLLITTTLKFVLSIVLCLIFKEWIFIVVSTFISIIPYVIIEYFDIRNQINNLCYMRN